MQKFKKFSARILSLTLTVAMASTMLPATVFATEDNTAFGASSLEYHAEHDKDCGYVEAVEGVPCSHENGDGTYSCASVSENCLLCGMKTADLQQCKGMAPALLASGDNAITVDGSSGYSLTANGLNKAVTDIAEGGTITLGGNITTSEYIAHTTAKNVTLDLNGYSLTTSATYGVIVSNGAGITIRSSKDGGKIEASKDAIRNVAGTASITIESGSIITTGSTAYAIYIASEGNVTVTGGTISSSSGEAIDNYKGNVTISGSPTITSACNNVNLSTIKINNGILTISGTPTISNTGSGQYGYCLSLLKGSGTISGGTISAKEGIAIRAFAPLSISGNTTVTSENSLTSNGTIMAGAALTLTDTAQVSNSTTDGNAIYLLGSSASYLFSATNVVGKIAPSYDVSGTIIGSDTSSGIAATLQLKQNTGVSIGTAVTAAADGTYTISVPQGTGYTIEVSMAGYTSGTIAAFNIVNSALAGKNLTLSKSNDTTIAKAITEANSAKNGIAISDSSASSVTNGTKFVTTAEMKALADAIAAAQAAANNPASTAAQVSAAVTALNNAVATFNAAVKIGTFVFGGSGGGGLSSGGSTPPASKPTGLITGKQYYGDSGQE